MRRLYNTFLAEFLLKEINLTFNTFMINETDEKILNYINIIINVFKEINPKDSKIHHNDIIMLLVILKEPKSFIDEVIELVEEKHYSIKDAVKELIATKPEEADDKYDKKCEIIYRLICLKYDIVKEIEYLINHISYHSNNTYSEYAILTLKSFLADLENNINDIIDNGITDDKYNELYEITEYIDKRTEKDIHEILLSMSMSL